MAEMGKAMMGTGEAEGDRRALDAAEAAISNPLLDDVSMKGAKGVLINITGGFDMTLYEVDEAANRIRDEVDQEANIIFGSTFDEKLNGRVRVSVVATGIGDSAPQQLFSHTTTAGAAAPTEEETLGEPTEAPSFLTSDDTTEEAFGTFSEATETTMESFSADESDFASGDDSLIFNTGEEADDPFATRSTEDEILLDNEVGRALRGGFSILGKCGRKRTRTR